MKQLGNKIIVYLDANATKPIYVNPIIIDFNWAYIYSGGLGVSDFGVAPFGDPE